MARAIGTGQLAARRRPARRTRLAASGIHERVHAGEPSERGRLIIVTGPEGRGKALLIGSARRRWADDPRVGFPLRVTTRIAGASDAEMSVTRRAFRDLVAAGGLWLTWSAAGHSFGIAPDARALLVQGRCVVVAAPQDSVAGFCDLWSAVDVIAVGSGPDGLPSPRRSAPPEPRPGSASASWHTLGHGADFAGAARDFLALLATFIEPAPAEPPVGMKDVAKRDCAPPAKRMPLQLAQEGHQGPG